MWQVAFLVIHILEFVVTRNVMLSKNDLSNFPGGASINLQDINIMQAQVSVWTPSSICKAAY